MMKYCDQCGKPDAQGGKFCPYCGAPQAVNSPQPPREEITESPAPMPPQHNIEKKLSACIPKKIRPWAGVLGVLILFIVAALLIINGRSTKRSLTASGEYGAFVYEGNNRTYEYIAYENCAVITGYVGKESHVIIPDTLDGRPVTELSGAFTAKKEDIVSITVPEGVTAIHGDVFSNLPNLRSLELPESAVDIDPAAFSGTPLFEDRSEEFVIINGVTLFKYNGPGGDVIIPDGVRSVGGFQRCWDLTSVTLPTSAIYIASSAFSDCMNLRQITMPNTIKTIDSYAFSDCNALVSITLPTGLQDIGYGAFQNCAQLSEIQFPKSLKSIAPQVFTGTPWLEDQSGLVIVGGILVDYRGDDALVTIPDDVTSISAAFKGNNAIETVVVPSSVKSIGQDAFTGCGALRELVVYGAQTSFSQSSLLELSYDLETDSLVFESTNRAITIYCPAGSPAEEFAKEFRISYRAVEDYVPGQRPLAQPGSLEGKYISRHAREEGVSPVEQFGSFVVFYADGTFQFRENYYDGLLDLEGTYQVTGNRVTCQHEADIDWFGRTWDKTFDFTILEEGTLRYEGDSMSMTSNGDIFER